MEGHRCPAQFRSLIRDQRGATAIEYGLLLSLVFLAVMAGVVALGETVQSRWNHIADSVAAI